MVLQIDVYIGVLKNKNEGFRFKKNIYIHNIYKKSTLSKCYDINWNFKKVTVNVIYGRHSVVNYI